MKTTVEFVLLVLASLFAGGASVQDSKATPPETEFVRVAADKWTFELVPSGRRFIPFGANFIFAYPPEQGGKQSLDVLTRPRWDPVLIRRAFEGARSLNMNVVKVFLPCYQALPDPQPTDRVAFGHMDPSLPERLDYVFKTARETGIYVSLTFAEWGSHSLKWWQDGGTFVGRNDEPNAPANSHAVLHNFWQALANRYKDEPALFSYNLAVEFYMPNANWGAQKGGGNKYNHVLSDRWGLPPWHAYLKQAFPDIKAINARWNSAYASIEGIPQPEFAWVRDGGSSHYTMPQAMLADYNSFLEYVTYAFFRNQVDAVRSVDRRHMITCGYHPHHPAIGWRSSAQYLAGTAPSELELFDYTTVHVYTDHDHKAGVDPRLFHAAIVHARFAYAGKPVIAEEMGHITRDRAETTRESLNLLKSLMPHASGFMLWFLSDPDAHTPYGPLNPDFTINAFGEEWRKAAEPAGLLSTLPTRRKPAAKTVHEDRITGLAPAALTEAQKLLDNWDTSPQPVDFILERHPLLDQLRKKTP